MSPRGAQIRIGAALRRGAGVLLAAPVVLVLWALPASAHASLDATTPAQGSQLSVAPASVSLLFDQQVGVNAGSLRVLDPGGRDVDAGPPAHPAGNDRAVRVGLKPALGRGSYTVSWRVVSADGHPVSGTFAFGVGVPAGTVQQQVSVDPPVASLHALAAFLSYVGTALLLGVSVFVFWLWPDGTASCSPQTRQDGQPRCSQAMPQQRRTR